MQKRFSLALVASAALMAVSAAHAASVTTNTPWDPGAPTDLSQFVDGNENVAETVTYSNDPDGKGIDIVIKTDPAGLGNDNADASVGDQFTNLYFGDDTNGAYVGFELGNSRAFTPGVAGYFDYTSALGITYTDTPGTTYANGGQASESQTFIPYSFFETDPLHMGFTKLAPGGVIQLRDIQAFAYAGNNAGGGARFGTLTIPNAVPEPATWALMIGGLGLVGYQLRRREGVRLGAA
jgi:hypothetical protein